MGSPHQVLQMITGQALRACDDDGIEILPDEELSPGQSPGDVTRRRSVSQAHVGALSESLGSQIVARLDKEAKERAALAQNVRKMQLQLDEISKALQSARA